MGERDRILRLIHAAGRAQKSADKNRHAGNWHTVLKQRAWAMNHAVAIYLNITDPMAAELIEGITGPDGSHKDGARRQLDRRLA